MALTEVIVGMMGMLGGFVVVYGGILIALGFGGDEGFARGWNSRKKQGLILGVAGGILMSLSGITGALDEMGALDCETFEFVGAYAPALSLAVVAYGVGQFALNLIHDDFGSRTWGIRLIIAGIAISQIGPVIDFTLAGLV